MGREDLDIEGRRADGTHFSVDIQLDVLPGIPVGRRDSARHDHPTTDVRRQRDHQDRSRQRFGSRIDHLQKSLDLVIQRLFALGTSITAGASNEAVLIDRLASATRGIDEVIEAVQQRRRTSGRSPVPSGTLDRGESVRSVLP